ncbi:MAG: ATP synthase F1 subunit delta [bacterium]|nr:ATP synthase F1 subunit delta [bacterium]
MKASVRQYARSVMELVADKSEAEAKALIAKFVVFLHGRQDLNKVEAITEELGRLYEIENEEIKAELISARPLQEAAKKQLVAYLQKRAGVDTVNLQESLNPDLLGGFILRYNGLVIDGSLKNNLLKFKKQLSN